MPSHKTATVLLSLLLSMTAYADDEVSNLDYCKDLSIIAKEIMTARQMDKPMSETLPLAVDRLRDMFVEYGRELDSDETEKITEMIAPLVMAAYESSSYPSDSAFEDARRKEISEFENMIFAECFKGTTADSEE